MFYFPFRKEEPQKNFFFPISFFIRVAPASDKKGIKSYGNGTKSEGLVTEMGQWLQKRDKRAESEKSHVPTPEAEALPASERDPFDLCNCYAILRVVVDLGGRKLRVPGDALGYVNRSAGI